MSWMVEIKTLSRNRKEFLICLAIRVPLVIALTVIGYHQTGYVILQQDLGRVRTISQASASGTVIQKNVLTPGPGIF